MAALMIPGFSVGAGDLGGAKRLDGPIAPTPEAGLALRKLAPSAARQPLAGICYGASFASNGVAVPVAAQPRNIKPASPPAAVAAGASARAVPASSDALDAAAPDAAVVLERFVAPPPAAVATPVAAGMAALAPVGELAMAPATPGLTDDANLAPPQLALSPGLASAPVSANSQIAASQPVVSPPVALASAATQPVRQGTALSAAAKPPAPFSASAAARGISTASPIAFDGPSQLVTRVDGIAAGRVDFQQTTTGLAVRLGSIVDVLGDRYDPGEIARIKGSAASNVYLSLGELQAQGIPISYDPVYDEFNVGHTDTRPKAARKVHIDQISTPERGAGTVLIDQVRR